MFDRFTKPRGDMTEKLLEKDCQECKIVGSVSMGLLGGFVVYHSAAPYYVKHKWAQVAIRGVAAGCFYLSAARWFYYPPFAYLQGTMDSVPINPKK